MSTNDPTMSTKTTVILIVLLGVAFLLGIIFGQSLCPIKVANAFGMEAQEPKEIQITDPAEELPAHLKAYSGKWIGISGRQDCFLIVTQIQEKYVVLIYAVGKVTEKGVHLLMWRQISCIVNDDFSLTFDDPMDMRVKRVITLVQSKESKMIERDGILERLEIDVPIMEVTVHEGFKKGFTAYLKKTDMKILAPEATKELFHDEPTEPSKVEKSKSGI